LEGILRIDAYALLEAHAAAHCPLLPSHTSKIIIVLRQLPLASWLCDDQLYVIVLAAPHALLRLKLLV
jgi:hypothetical protein